MPAMKNKKQTSVTSALPLVPSRQGQLALPPLAAGLVHEIKNPLAAIHMHLQLLQNYAEEVGEEQLRLKLNTKISLIQDEILSLNRTLHSFFSLLKPQQNASKKNYHLDQLLEEIVHLLEPQCTRAGIEVRFHKSGLSKCTQGDPVFLRQIVLNFMLNAIQAFEDSDFQSTGRAPYIDLIAEQRQGKLYIEVRDNGPGISPEVQEKIFDAFYSTRKSKGGGLGLTIAQKMIVAMGARLEVKSKSHEGTAFIVILGQGLQ